MNGRHIKRLHLRSRPYAKGHTLIDALVAVVVVTGASLAGIGNAAQLAETASLTRETQRALQLAQGLIESVRSGLAPQAAAAALRADAAGSGSAYEIRWSSAALTGWPAAADAQRWWVQVRWQDRRGRTQSVQIDSFIAPWPREAR